jgi:hypothetical protein
MRTHLLSSVTVKGRASGILSRIHHSNRNLTLPRRRKKKFTRPALPAGELEAKILELIRQNGARRKITGVEFVYVGSLGSEPNWFARPLPSRVSEACMREFVSALAQVRRAHDLLFNSTTHGATAMQTELFFENSQVFKQRCGSMQWRCWS